MKRVALFSLLALAVATAVAVPFAFASGDSRGPACTNIIDGGNGANDGFFANGDGTGTFNFSMTLAAPACKNATATYTFYVSYNGGPFTAISGVANGTVVTMPAQTYQNVTTSSNVCVYATSAKSDDGDIADRAPDNGCLTYILDSAPGQSGFH